MGNTIMRGGLIQQRVPSLIKMKRAHRLLNILHDKSSLDKSALNKVLTRVNGLGRITFESSVMSPALPNGSVILFRKVNNASDSIDEIDSPLPLRVGDIAIAKHPSTDTKIVRRVTATEGDVIESTDSNEEDFVIPENHVWLNQDCDIDNCEPDDSRSFGPLPLNLVVGRGYTFSNSSDMTTRNRFDQNETSMSEDDTCGMLTMEEALDVQQMVKLRRNGMAIPFSDSLFPKKDDKRDDK